LDHPSLPQRSLLAPLALVALAATACGGLTSDELAAVRRMQVRTVSPSYKCQNLGSVSGSPKSEGAGGMRAQAVRKGGNTLSLNEDGTATVLYCPEAAVATPDADP